MMVMAIWDYIRATSASHSLVNNIPECTQDDVIHIVVKTQIVCMYVHMYVQAHTWSNAINGVL